MMLSPWESNYKPQICWAYLWPFHFNSSYGFKGRNLTISMWNSSSTGLWDRASTAFTPGSLPFTWGLSSSGSCHSFLGYVDQRQISVWQLNSGGLTISDGASLLLAHFKAASEKTVRILFPALVEETASLFWAGHFKNNFAL